MQSKNGYMTIQEYLPHRADMGGWHMKRGQTLSKNSRQKIFLRGSNTETLTVQFLYIQ